MPNENKEHWTNRNRISSARHYRFPSLVISKAEDAYLIDTEGTRYLDFTSGGQTANLGHGTDSIISAVKAQMDETGLASLGWTLNDTRIRTAEKLREIAPGNLSDGKVGFSNTGSDATELSMRLAKDYTSRSLILCTFGCFHGQTSLGALSLNTSPHGRKYGFPLLPGILYVPYPYCYRCPFGQTYPDCDFECVDFVEYQFETKVIPPERVAAFFLELVQVHGGVIPLPDGYLERIRQLCKEEGILLVVDEVTTGFGRTGKMFATEHWDVDVDMLYMAKPIAAGLSMAAIIAESSVMTNFRGGGTFSGNPVACAASLANISAIQEEDVLAHAQQMGMYLVEQLQQIRVRHPIIGDIRGLGPLVGVELVEDRRLKTPASEETKKVIRKSAERGLLFFPAGVYQNVLRLCPPLTIQTKEIDAAVEILDEALP
ncbi:MAG: aspartate aminotransferase family protein [Candidatus Thorarchaeota archaeon]